VLKEASRDPRTHRTNLPGVGRGEASLLGLLDELDLDRDGKTDFLTLLVGNADQKRKLLVEDFRRLEDLNWDLDAVCFVRRNLGKRDFEGCEHRLSLLVQRALQVEVWRVWLAATVAELQLDRDLFAGAGDEGLGRLVNRDGTRRVLAWDEAFSGQLRLHDLVAKHLSHQEADFVSHLLVDAAMHAVGARAEATARLILRVFGFLRFYLFFQDLVLVVSHRTTDHLLNHLAFLPHGLLIVAAVGQFGVHGEAEDLGGRSALHLELEAIFLTERSFVNNRRNIFFGMFVL